MGQNKSGRRFAAASMVLALVALAVTPAVFGPLGILMGMVVVSKGERYLGMLGHGQRNPGCHRVLHSGSVDQVNLTPSPGVVSPP